MKMVNPMSYLILFFLCLLWAIGNQCFSRLGMKRGIISLTVVTYLSFLTSYLADLLYNYSLDHTNRFSMTILISYLLVATMISFFMVTLSLITVYLIPQEASRTEFVNECQTGCGRL